jgi:ADP-heptose:LPS heptosyltransferase
VTIKPSNPAPAFVFHRGALGDSILCWPLLRALQATHDEVIFVTDRSKSSLAASELGTALADAELRDFANLWVNGAPPVAARSASVVISLMHRDDEARAVWHRNAAAMFTSAEITFETRVLDRGLAIELAQGDRSSPPRCNPAGPIVLHLGAGDRRKWWPIDRWAELASTLRARGLSVEVRAGEVEAERMTPRERETFEHLNGRFCASLLELRETILAARLFVAADTGPAHLAGQLGINTLALFGPTDPDLWSPIGPQVRVVRSSTSHMDDLSLARALEAVDLQCQSG